MLGGSSFAKPEESTRAATMHLIVSVRSLIDQRCPLQVIDSPQVTAKGPSHFVQKHSWWIENTQAADGLDIVINHVSRIRSGVE